MSTELKVGLIGLAGTIFSITVATFGPHLLKKILNGRVEEAAERARFYRDIHRELDEEKAERRKLEARIHELERQSIEDALDRMELRRICERYQPQLADALAVLERMELRTRRPA